MGGKILIDVVSRLNPLNQSWEVLGTIEKWSHKKGWPWNIPHPCVEKKVRSWIALPRWGPMYAHSDYSFVGVLLQSSRHLVSFGPECEPMKCHESNIDCILLAFSPWATDFVWSVVELLSGFSIVIYSIEIYSRSQSKKPVEFSRSPRHAQG